MVHLVPASVQLLEYMPEPALCLIEFIGDRLVFAVPDQKSLGLLVLYGIVGVCEDRQLFSCLAVDYVGSVDRQRYPMEKM